MNDKSNAKNDGPMLEVALDRSRLPVSNLSSLLRVLQAALREIARSSDEGRRAFAESPYPVLVTAAATEEDQESSSPRLPFLLLSFEALRKGRGKYRSKSRIEKKSSFCGFHRKFSTSEADTKPVLLAQTPHTYAYKT